MSRRSTRPRVLGWAAGALRGQDVFFEILDILHRGMRLRCPCCGQGRLFKSALRTYDRCQACDERFEREPGQSFGAVYVNLGLSGLLTLTAYLMTTTLFSLTMPQQRSILIPVAVLGPCLCFRLARGLWTSIIFLGEGLYLPWPNR